MSRPQIGIERLPVRKATNEPRESMNCKSCRKRKIKCNRLKPSCEACLVFKCACIYDAVPKKRGPKTDVLKTLLKGVSGLENRRKDEQKNEKPNSSTMAAKPEAGARKANSSSRSEAVPRVPSLPPSVMVPLQNHTKVPDGPTWANREALASTAALLDTYFARLHSKPYYILDETATRQRLRDGALPPSLVNAIHAVTTRYVPHLCGGLPGAIRASREYASRACSQIDVDEASIDNLQALLLLSLANYQNGRAKRSHMALSHAINIAFALDLHRELPAELRIASPEREGRRQLFWTCYIMDRFSATGLKRPSRIPDEAIDLRLPASLLTNPPAWSEGPLFAPDGGSSSHAHHGPHGVQGGASLLVDIVRILGVTNRYLAAGGVRGDSFFPWHIQSTLSKIKADLDHWATNNGQLDVWGPAAPLFASPDSSSLVLSRLIYHLIHCLIYRPFLPVSVAELSEVGQYQAWRAEVTNLCFKHANAMADTVEAGNSMAIPDWPSFVGYCICTAGTVHVHGAHYMSYHEEDPYRRSAELLTREMAQLLEMRLAWAALDHQCETLAAVYNSHIHLIQALETGAMRGSNIFQMEEFFTRYPGRYLDGAYIAPSDTAVDVALDFSAPVSASLRDVGRSSSYDANINAPNVFLGQQYMPYAVDTSLGQQIFSEPSPYLTPTPEDGVHAFHPKPAPRTSSLVSSAVDTPDDAAMWMQKHRRDLSDRMATRQQSASTPSLGLDHSPSSDLGRAFMPIDRFPPNHGRNEPRASHSGSTGHGMDGSPVSVDGDPFLMLLDQMARPDGLDSAGQYAYVLNSTS